MTQVKLTNAQLLVLKAVTEEHFASELGSVLLDTGSEASANKVRVARPIYEGLMAFITGSPPERARQFSLDYEKLRNTGAPFLQNYSYYWQGLEKIHAIFNASKEFTTATGPQEYAIRILADPKTGSGLRELITPPSSEDIIISRRFPGAIVAANRLWASLQSTAEGNNEALQSLKEKGGDWITEVKKGLAKVRIDLHQLLDGINTTIAENSLGTRNIPPSPAR